MARLKSVLREKLGNILPRHKIDAMVTLLSMHGCKAQLEHTDLSPETLANVLLPQDDEDMPLPCLVALTDDTVFDVWPGAIRFDSSRKYKQMQIRLRAGDVLIFRGDLVHAGAAVGLVENVRFHGLRGPIAFALALALPERIAGSICLSHARWLLFGEPYFARLNHQTGCEVVARTVLMM